MYAIWKVPEISCTFKKSIPALYVLVVQKLVKKIISSSENYLGI